MRLAHVFLLLGAFGVFLAWSILGGSHANVAWFTSGDNHASVGIQVPYHELSTEQQLLVHRAFLQEVNRLRYQAEWRLEQANLYRRWEAVRTYQGMLSKLDDMIQVVHHLSIDPSPYYEDLRSMNDQLTGRSGQ